DPDYLVATSDLDDDAATAVHQSHADAAAVALPKRPDAEGFVSFLRSPDDVDAVCKKYGVPEDHYTARLAGDLRACSPPPPGCVCVYAHALEAGMRVPLHPFFCEALAHFGVAPTQLAPNAWRIMAGFLVLCRSAGVPPSLAVFRRFFVLSVLNHRHTKRWYYFQTRFRDSSGLRFAGLPDSINGWKRGFFFLSSPTPWPCPVEWGEPSKSSFVDPVLTNEEKKSVAKLLRASGGAAVDIRTCLSDSNIAATVVTAASPAPPSARTSASSKGKR
uniref:Transposase (putative) gypsy type domain-containing protein n=1 Tax=Aegilops tauschii subsp. strangulata TaxID=200361 RepID=A0A453QW77_AEGTS